MKKMQSGFSLLELLVTMVISIIILTGVINVASGSLGSNKALENMAAMQDSARFAVDMMARDIRQAGYTGCRAYASSDSEGSMRAIYSKSDIFQDQILKGIQGWNANASPNAGMVTASTVRASTDGSSWTSSGDNVFTDAYPQALASSDLLRLWTVEEGVELAQENAIKNEDGTIILTTARATNEFLAGDIIVFANCAYRAIAQACSVNSAAGSTTITIQDGSSETCANTIEGEFDTSQVGAVVTRFAGISYFIGKRDEHEKTQPSLYRAEGDAVRELVEGVESMQILYGVDTDTGDDIPSVNVYVTADQVGDRWNDVVSVRISLLMRSFEENVVPEDTTFTFYGADGTSTDGRIRHVYSTTITLRNRVSGV